jgi:hypothetical protein
MSTKIKQLKKLEILAKLAKYPVEETFIQLDILNERVNLLQEEVAIKNTPIKGDKGDTVIGPPGPKGDKGDKGDTVIGQPGPEGKPGISPDPQKIAELASKLTIEQLKPLIPINTLKEEDLSKLGPIYRDALESLKNEDRLDASAIKNLDSYIKKQSITSQQPIYVGGSGQHNVIAYDLSSQLNGVLKTFNLPALWRVISVHSTSFPYSFRESVDYTWTLTSITFTSEINEQTTLASGQTLTLIYSE